ncbi:PadR family transcriptional regulator [Pontibacter sp. G13]|uniref:PadR family transcriptional regulator n=1 Tax=Pontibacter sp. G13 TaxID=3074898 RepID=UPI00288C4CC5|nr:PadR family transcriptional regulator [Pontibacter sp. G13]WNJ16770.1 PadR family transcriptional regulator [Pontibacter sp. G13]
MYSKELLKGSLRTIILRLLEEEGRMYGYEITRHVAELSDGEIKLTEGALYPTLHKLESEGLLTTEKVSIGKRVRKYYQLTDLGTETAQAKMDEFIQYMRTMQRVLKFRLDASEFSA